MPIPDSLRWVGASSRRVPAINETATTRNFNRKKSYRMHENLPKAQAVWSRRCMLARGGPGDNRRCIAIRTQQDHNLQEKRTDTFISTGTVGAR